MKWSPEAEDAVKKVPFFVRKKVRTRVEEQARSSGHRVVTLADVKTAQARFIAKMSEEVKGYRVDTCFAAAGCPNRAMASDRLLEGIERIAADADLLGFLKERVQGDLKYHHEFRISLADCPNACSQPQIKDIGILGALQPEMTDEPCSQCNACVDVCPDECVAFEPGAATPRIQMDRCMQCGKCAAACPTGTIVTGRQGYRVQLGGKLGRHPRLARELPGLYSETKVLEIVKYCINFYKGNSTKGERFAEIFGPSDFDALVGILNRG